jgi:hypothetical protein
MTAPRFPRSIAFVLPALLWLAMPSALAQAGDAALPTIPIE